MKSRDWLALNTQTVISKVLNETKNLSPDQIQNKIENLAKESHEIHDVNSINLNPATNVLNPRAEALLASGMSSRASLGHPGDKYEVGLDAIEEIEVITNELACKLFAADYAEYRHLAGVITGLTSALERVKDLRKYEEDI